MFNIFKKKVEITVKKSADIQQAVLSQIQSSNSNGRVLTPKKALFYYDLVSPVATAVDTINDEYKTLIPVIESNGEIITDHPLLTFLQHPNDDMVLVDFLETMGNFYLVTNEVYLVATGDPKREPAELMVVSPELVEIKKDKKGFVNKIEVRREMSNKITFTRSEDQFRFFNKEGNAEIWQIKGFDTRQTGRGRSKLNSAIYEVEQYLQCAIHNLSLLENGLTTSGAFTADDGLSDEQYDRLREQSTFKQEGSNNAGKILILENGMKYVEMGMSPKDMDFKELKKGTEQSIFKRFKIPLALISTEHMAEATMAESKLILYDNVILPLAKRLFDEISRFLGPRFDLKENERLVPFMDKITALQIRRVKEIKDKKETNVFTINEIRELTGQDPVEGGDAVYIASNLVPAGTSPVNPFDTRLNNSNPNDDEDDEDSAEVIKTTRETFINILKLQVDLKGNRTYTDKEINKFADEENL